MVGLAVWVISSFDLFPLQPLVEPPVADAE
jgi:hypothetical protein